MLELRDHIIRHSYLTGNRLEKFHPAPILEKLRREEAEPGRQSRRVQADGRSYNLVKNAVEVLRWAQPFSELAFKTRGVWGGAAHPSLRLGTYRIM